MKFRLEPWRRVSGWESRKDRYTVETQIETEKNDRERKKM